MQLGLFTGKHPRDVALGIVTSFAASACRRLGITPDEFKCAFDEAYRK